MFSDYAFGIFQESIQKYHIIDRVDQPFENPYPGKDIAHLLYRKNWIDTVQWHFEDLIRDPEIDPKAALELKRKIDASNQERTDLVSFFYEGHSNGPGGIHRQLFPFKVQRCGCGG